MKTNVFFLPTVCVNNLCIDCTFRSTHLDGAGKTQDRGLYSVTSSRGQEGGLLRRPLHRQVGVRVGRRDHLQRHVPGPPGGTARVEEMHRGAAAHVLLCE